MTSKALVRFTALSGLATVALYLAVAAIMLDAPEVSQPDTQVLAWIREHRTAMLGSAYLWGLCVTTTFFFLTGLWGLLKEKEGGSGTFATLGLAGGFATFSVALVGFLFDLAAAYRAETLAAPTAKLLNDLTVLAVALTGFPTVVSMVGYTTVMVHKKLFPTVLRWFGGVTAVVHLISGGAFAQAGLLSPSGVGIYVAPVFYYLWILAVSLHLLLRWKE